MNTYDIVIIGGGAAGMMAAFSAREHHKDASIVIVDHTFELGRKILVAGAGRGNLTNANLEDDNFKHFHGNPTIIREIFSQYNGKRIQAIFENFGVPLYEEQKTGRGKIFPIVDNAKTVRDILVDELQKKHIETRTSTEVIGISKKENGWNISTDTAVIVSHTIILACGGMTYPSLGSNGSGYTLARNVGHTIIEPVPSAVPLIAKSVLCHFLQGERILMEISTKEHTYVGDVLFTQYGVSGSAVFDISRDISIQINREHAQSIPLYLSFFPSVGKDEVLDIVEKRFLRDPNQSIARSLWGLFTVKVANAICAASTIQKEAMASTITHEEKMKLVETLTRYELIITGTRGWNEAEFTSGGISTDEVDTRTLASKKADHLYVAGELLDVDGDVGGYNLSWAWASGWTAGKLQ